MKTIYVDSDFKCHVSNDGTMNAVETDFFDGKCDTFIEGFRYVPHDKTWTRSDGVVFNGEMISAWKDYKELDDAQREYEREKFKEYENELAELDAAMLEMQYQNLTEGL